MTSQATSVITKAIKESELDCSTWSEEICRELAMEIIAALYKAGFRVKQDIL